MPCKYALHFKSTKLSSTKETPYDTIKKTQILQMVWTFKKSSMVLIKVHYFSFEKRKNTHTHNHNVKLFQECDERAPVKSHTIKTIPLLNRILALN